MIKLIAFFKRKAGMPVEDFQAYWRTTHADIVVKLPGIRRYVQSHTILSGYRREREPVYDGMAELWFDNTEVMRRQVGTSELAAVQSDEANFMDGDSQGSIITEEHLIKDGPVPADGVKNVEFVNHKPGMPIEDFQTHWREIHGPLGAAIPVIRRYVQSHTRPSIYKSGKTPIYDGVALTWFDSTQAMRLSATTPEYERTRADEPNFIAAGKLPVIITKEHIIVG